MRTFLILASLLAVPAAAAAQQATPDEVNSVLVHDLGEQQMRQIEAHAQLLHLQAENARLKGELEKSKVAVAPRNTEPEKPKAESEKPAN